MLKTFLVWIGACLFGPRELPVAGEFWVFRETDVLGRNYYPVQVLDCDGKTVNYRFQFGVKSQLNVCRFVAYYRRVDARD